jgi:hypothetical protein
VSVEKQLKNRALRHERAVRGIAAIMHNYAILIKGSFHDRGQF